MSKRGLQISYLQQKKTRAGGTYVFLRVCDVVEEERVLESMLARDVPQQARGDKLLPKGHRRRRIRGNARLDHPFDGTLANETILQASARDTSRRRTRDSTGGRRGRRLRRRARAEERRMNDDAWIIQIIGSV